MAQREKNEQESGLLRIDLYLGFLETAQKFLRYMYLKGVLKI